MKCSHCNQRIAPTHRGDSQFCSTKCRVASHRSSPPKVLRDIARWVRWSAEKVPKTIENCAASSTDPATWTDYASVVASNVGVGVGFVLSSDDRIVCVDLDGCLDSRGRLHAWAIPVLESVPATYVEVSPSGTGLHIWGFGDVTKGRRTKGIEVYGSGRYITVTGRRYRHSVGTFADLDDWLATLPM